MLLRNTYELPPHVVLRRNARAKRIALRLDPKERVFHLTVPKGMSIRRACAFAEEHESWMQDALMALPTPVPFVQGQSIPVFGKNRTIEIHYDEDLRRINIELRKNTLHVETNLETPHMRIQRFLRELAKERLTALSHRKAERIGKKLSSVSVRDTKSRWGSCSHDNKINYSWRLIFAPYESLDYVVAHEVAHLKHLDHSKAFWNICRELSVDFFEGQYWMQEHGHELMRYGFPPNAAE